jgi:hypothetical protein
MTITPGKHYSFDVADVMWHLIRGKEWVCVWVCVWVSDILDM